MMRKNMILALGCAAALLAACDSTRGSRPADGSGYRSSSDVYSRDATARGGDTYDNRGIAGSTTSGRATILHQDRPGGSDYDPYRSDLGRSDGGPGILHQDRPGGSDDRRYDSPRY